MTLLTAILKVQLLRLPHLAPSVFEGVPVLRDVDRVSDLLAVGGGLGLVSALAGVLEGLELSGVLVGAR